MMRIVSEISELKSKRDKLKLNQEPIELGS
jgi:hypothetical protein